MANAYIKTHGDLLKALPTKEPHFVEQLLAAIERSQLDKERKTAKAAARQRGYVEPKLKALATEESFEAPIPRNPLQAHKMMLQNKVPAILDLIESNPEALARAEAHASKAQAQRVKVAKRHTYIRNRAIHILEKLNRMPQLQKDGSFRVVKLSGFERALRDALRDAQQGGALIPFTFIGGEDPLMTQLIARLKTERRAAKTEAKLREIKAQILSLPSDERRALVTQFQEALNATSSFKILR